MERSSERGNALIYVLIAVALFAALNFTLSRNNSDSGGKDDLDDGKAELYASQLISYAAQAKMAVDQLTFEGARIDQLDFIPPSDAAFETGSDILKVYHPGGAGLSPGNVPKELIAQVDTNPVSGWYMGRFNNIEWSETTADDVMLVAHQISRQACENINRKVTGSAVIPATNVAIADILIDASEHSGTNQAFSIANCTACENIPALCVSNAAVTKFSFYSVIINR